VWLSFVHDTALINNEVAERPCCKLLKEFVVHVIHDQRKFEVVFLDKRLRQRNAFVNVSRLIAETERSANRPLVCGVGFGDIDVQEANLLLESVLGINKPLHRVIERGSGNRTSDKHQWSWGRIAWVIVVVFREFEFFLVIQFHQ